MSSDARDARNLVACATWGVLSTLSRQSGHPFGSVVPFDVDENGCVTILIATISEHYKNIMADRRASLLVSAAGDASDPQPFARATLLLNLIPFDEELAKHSYYTRFPASREYDKTHGFEFFRGEVSRVRWIGGFGEISWITGAEYGKAEASPLAYSSRMIIDHMNEDHLDALHVMVRAAGGDTLSLKMTAVDELGFVVQSGYGMKGKEFRFDFDHPVKTVEEVRGAIILPLRKARAKLTA